MQDCDKFGIWTNKGNERRFSLVCLALMGATAGLLLAAEAIKRYNESRGDVYLPKDAILETVVAFRSEGSTNYDKARASFMASPKGGNLEYIRPLTTTESNLVNHVEFKR